jgi:predicted lactoylglutathione lyase
MMSSAIESGDTEFREPQEYVWMYGRSFEDINGHIWGNNLHRKCNKKIMKNLHEFTFTSYKIR